LRIKLVTIKENYKFKDFIFVIGDGLIKNQWSLGALVAGILTILIELLVGTGGVILMIIAIVFGIVGLVKYKKNPDIGGKWLSIAGIVIVVVYIIYLFLPVLNIGIGGVTGTTTPEDQANIIGTWTDEYGYWYYVFMENGSLYQVRELSDIGEEESEFYKMENGLLYMNQHDYDWDKALDWTYKFEDENTTLILREPWWDDSYDDTIFYRVD
jgi:hypothetical protein